MKRILRTLSFPFTLFCAAFALWIASIEVTHRAAAVSPAGAATPAVQDESAAPPSNEIADFPQLD